MYIRMTELRTLAEEIAIDFNRSIRERVDELLEIDCKQYCWLGMDSTPEDKAMVREQSQYIYEIINELDKHTGELLLSSAD
jgi:hypothetical protein